MLIHVTRQDIKRAIKSDSESCPIALALRRTGKWKEISVNPLGVNIILLDGNCYRGDEEIQAFIEDFDETGDVEPFTLNTDNLIKEPIK